MTIDCEPYRPAGTPLLTALMAVEEVAVFARSGRNDTLSRFLDEVACALRAACRPALPRLGSPAPD